MVSGDVFRAPKNPLLLCVEVGSGVQICTSAFSTLLLTALGAIIAVVLDILNSAMALRTVATCCTHL